MKKENGGAESWKKMANILLDQIIIKNNLTKKVY